MPTWFEKEIREQPDSLARLLERGRAAAEAIAARVRAAKPSFVFIAARGSSDNAARYAQYLFGERHRLAVALASPSLFTMYRTPPSLAGALVIAISQSGRSPDVVEVIAEGRRQGAVTIALTNDAASPLAAAAEHAMALHAGEERAVAATKTYTHELAALAMLSAAMAGGDDGWRALGTLPAQLAGAIAPVDAARLAPFRNAPAFVSLGRGYNLATAFEVALKLKETSYVVAEPYSAADFLHGPVAMLEPGFPSIVVDPSSAALARAMDEAMTMLEKKGARRIAISDRDEVLARADLALRMPRVAEWISPIVSVVPGQMVALALCTLKGHDPDAPRGLRKVTETR